MIYTLKNNHLTVAIDTMGAELTSVMNRDDYEYIWNGAEWLDHAPILFPTCGKLKDGKYTSCGREYKMISHGFTRRTEFKIAESTHNSISLTLEPNDDIRAVYPFDFKLTASYKLDENKVYASFKVENTGKHILPYMLGWHPGFVLDGNAPINSFYVDFGEKTSLTRYTLQNGPFINPFYTSYSLNDGKYYLDEEEIYSNDTMIFKDVPSAVTLRGEGTDRSITLTYSNNLPYFCIWKAPYTNARFICLEPWSDLPSDGETPENFDSRQMSRLSAGMSADYNYSVEFN